MTDAFEVLQRQYFDPLAIALGLTKNETANGRGYATVSAAAGNVRVHFDSDRGLCAFAVGAASSEKSLCGVDEFARRFPRVRKLPDGEQRLSLAEQAAFIAEHWNDLQTMFSPEHMGETIAWRNTAAKEFMKRYT